MAGTKLVVWDIDGVWYPGYATSHAAHYRTGDYKPLLKDIVEKMRLFSYEHVEMWKEMMGRSLDSIGDVSDMMNDFRYTDMRNTVYAGMPVEEARQRTVRGKHYLLKGMTLDQVRMAADGIPYTEGLEEAVRGIRNAGIRQAGFSNGLGPFVAYKMMQQGVEVGGIVPSLVQKGVGRFPLTIGMLDCIYEDGVTLEGFQYPFNKRDDISNLLAGMHVPEVAMMDDSASNVLLMGRVWSDGGVAVGLCPTEAEMPAFKEAGVPVLRERDLRLFAEIAKDRKKIPEYCETWGLDA